MSDFILNFKAPTVDTKGIMGLFHSFEDVQAAADKLKRGDIPSKTQIEAIINAASVLVDESQRSEMREYLLTEATVNDLIKMTSTITGMTKQSAQPA